LRPDAAASAIARAFLRRYGLAGQFRQSVETVVAAMALVAAGEGLAVVPAAAAAVRPRGVVLRRFTDATDQVEIAACWQRDDPPILLEPFLVAARLAVAEAVATGWR
jgi:DNA-binding transcriptional LysR family regulator